MPVARRSANAEPQHLAGTAGSVGAVTVDRDSGAAGVAQHDLETVSPDGQLLSIVKDSAYQQVTVSGRDLDVATGAVVGHRERGRRDPMPRGVMRAVMIAATGRSVMVRLGRMVGSARRRRRCRRRRGRRGGQDWRDRRWARTGQADRGVWRLAVGDRMAERDATDSEQRDCCHGRHDSQRSGRRLAVAAAMMLAPQRRRLAMSACHPFIIPCDLPKSGRCRGECRVLLTSAER
jgi:hypothetical protein